MDEEKKRSSATRDVDEEPLAVKAARRARRDSTERELATLTGELAALD